MKSPSSANENSHTAAVPPIVDQDTWEAALDELRGREKAATRELDAIAAARRRLPMVELPDYTLDGPDGPVRLEAGLRWRFRDPIDDHSRGSRFELEFDSDTGNAHRRTAALDRRR